MARVPVQTLPEVQLTAQGPGTLQVDTTVQPFRNAAPEQAQQLGSAMEKAGNQMTRIADRLQGELDDARANEAFNAFSLQVDEIEANYLGTTGQTAVSQFNLVNTRMTELMDEFSQGLDNDIQRAVFRETAGRRMRSVSTSATRHSISEQRRYNIGEREAKIANHARSAGRYWDTRDDPNGDFAVYAGAAVREAELLAQDLGYPPGSEQYNEVIVKAQTGVHTMVVQTLVAENKFVEAMEYLEDAFESGEMEFAAYNQMRSAATAGYRREQGVNAGRRAFEGTGRVTGTDFDSAAAWVMSVEGGYVADDAGQGPGNMGILASANQAKLDELGVDNVANLTNEQAKEIYRGYWNEIDADNLPPEIRMIAFDTAVNMGGPAARRLLRESGGDPARMIELRREHYARLIEQNPETYQQYARGWENRLRQLEGSIGRVGQEAPGGRYELPSLRDVLANIRATVTDPEEREYAEAWATQTYNQEVALREEEYRAVLQQAQDIAYAEGGSWQDIPADMLTKLKPDDRARLVEGAARGDEPDLVLEIMRNPSMTLPGNIEQYRSRLSESTYRSFVAAGLEMQNNPGKEANAVIDTEIFNSVLLDNDLTDYIDPSNEDQTNAVIRLRSQYDRRMIAEQNRLNRDLSYDEKTRVLQGIINDTVFLREFGTDPQVPLFAVSRSDMPTAYVPYTGTRNTAVPRGTEIMISAIPRTQQNAITTALREEGEVISMSAIINRWVDMGMPGREDVPEQMEAAGMNVAP